jgi:murein L,D-transpeptidase YcbB/YkuD
MSDKIKRFRVVEILLRGAAVCAVAGVLVYTHAAAEAQPLRDFGGSVVQSDGGLAVSVSLGVDATLDAGQVAGKRLFDVQALRDFYDARRGEGYWVRASGPYSRAHDFAKVLTESWMHGLNPEQYHVSLIRDLLRSNKREDRAALELLLSDAFVRYARDLSGIRVDTSGLRTDDKSWLQPITARSALSYLEQETRLNRILERVEPQGRTYKILQKELVRLSRAGEEDYTHVLPIEFGGILLRPGERHGRVPDLRLRLGVEPQTADARLYDDRLAAAVIRFQREHSLIDDAILGSGTLQILNRTNEGRKKQIIANLERLRWVPEKKPDRFVVVNVPAATLWAIDNHKVVFEMPVMVGQPVRPTETFVTEIEGVRFNPDWTIPPTIKRYDVVPRILKNPNYLADKGIELIRGHGANARTLEPSSIDWASISSKELNALRMVQVPGDHNPLGRIRILMPNLFNIYLHDTNHPEYFDEPARAISSGCMRMKYPEKMAEFIMDKESDWSSDDMQRILDTGKKTDVMIKHKLPVYVLYYTVWTDSRGNIVYGSDIYNQDRRLIEKLESIDGIHVPVHNQASVVGSGHFDRSVAN